MDLKKNISENLILVTINENNWDENDKLIAVDCYFEFVNKPCSAIVVVKDLDSAGPKYAMIESETPELHTSFVETLERDDVRTSLKDSINEFIKNEWVPNINP